MATRSEKVARKIALDLQEVGHGVDGVLLQRDPLQKEPYTQDGL